MDLSQRVARRFKAELLTKRWLMGVRRGWLSLMTPRIHDWDDVQRAIDKLIGFVSNLREQTDYVRRSVPNPKRDKLFANLLKDVKDQRRRAEHWMEVHQDTNPMNRGSFPPESGAKMLKIYQTDFAGAMTTEVRTRGGYNPTRVGSLTEVLDKILASLRDDAKRLQDTSNELDPDVLFEEYEEPAFKEFSYGRMKVVVIDADGKGRLIRQYVKHIDKAYALLKRKGFEKLWYGTMFLGTETNKLSEPQQQAYARAGYDNLKASAGMYHSGKDVVDLTNAPGSYVTEVIVHELGHRYWYKFLSNAQRAKFESLVKVRGTITEIPPKILTRIAEDIQDRRVDIENALKAFKKDDDHWLPAIDRVLSSVGNGIFILKTFTHGPQMESLLTPWLDKEAIQSLRQWDSSRKALQKLQDNTNTILKVQTTDGSNFERERRDWIAQMDDDLVTAEKELFGLVHAIDMLQKDKVRQEDARDRRNVMPVSQYGKSNIREAWAEVFTYYVLGRDMNRDQIESFREVLASQGALDTELSLMPPLRQELCGYTSYSYSRV